MNNRINKIRKHFRLTQTEFGAKIGGLSQNYVWMLEKGERTPSDRTIYDICREFGVNELWLRTGEGEMFRAKTRDVEIAEYVGKVLSGSDEFQRRFIALLTRLTTDDWRLIEYIALKLAEEVKKGTDAGYSASVQVPPRAPNKNPADSTIY